MTWMPADQRSQAATKNRTEKSTHGTEAARAGSFGQCAVRAEAGRGVGLDQPRTGRDPIAQGAAKALGQRCQITQSPNGAEFERANRNATIVGPDDRFRNGSEGGTSGTRPGSPNRPNWPIFLSSIFLSRSIVVRANMQR